MKNPLILLLTCILLYSCASQLPPTGGPKDEDPPVLLYSDPENNTLNWNEAEIQLTFDETVKANDFKNELLITPIYFGEYDFKFQREVVVITFEEPFDDSTTYTLNFREAIGDIHEGNSAVDLRIAFSTWGYLDSLELSGNVRNLLLDEPAENFTVGLYSASDTITPLNGSPTYLTKTNKFGFYVFHNLKSAEYRVYSFLDKNNNLKIDSKNETYGFLPETVLLDTTKSDVDMVVVDLNLDKLKINSHRQSGQYFEIKFPKFITNYTLEKLDSNINVPLFYRMVDNNKTIKVYNTLDEIDSIEVRITYSDSLLQTATDTLFIGFNPSSRKSDDFTVFPESTFLNGQMQTKLRLSKPLEFINLDSINIKWDSLNITYFDSTNISEPESYFQFILEKDFSADSLYLNEQREIPLINFGINAFISIESDSSEKISQKIIEKNLSEFGSIEGTINIPYENYILQLLDKDNMVVISEKNIMSYSFNQIKAGKYRIRVIIDVNGNGEWDGGSITEFIEPEPVIFFEAENGDQVITLRANWELVDMNIETSE